MSRTLVITGAGSGFGFGLARRSLELGHRVLATDEHLEGWPDRLGSFPDTLRVARLDVRLDADVAAAVAAVADWPVDVLVNNAGYAFFAAQEEGSLELFRDLLEVNVVGVVRVTRAFLPSLRRHRGTVVQLASVAGRTAFPESGFYAATKHAVEALSESLLQETAAFGVRIRVIEPGSFDTGFLARAARESTPPRADSPYADLRPVWNARKFAVLEPPQPAALVVDAILAGLDSPAPFERAIVGADAVRMMGLRDALGADAWLRLAAARHGADGAGPTPRAVLEGRDLEPARLALEHGFLGHWEGDEEGRAALRVLRAL